MVSLRVLQSYEGSRCVRSPGCEGNLIRINAVGSDGGVVTGQIASRVLGNGDYDLSCLASRIE